MWDASVICLYVMISGSHYFVTTGRYNETSGGFFLFVFDDGEEIIQTCINLGLYS